MGRKKNYRFEEKFFEGHQFDSVINIDDVYFQLFALNITHY